MSKSISSKKSVLLTLIVLGSAAIAAAQVPEPVASTSPEVVVAQEQEKPVRKPSRRPPPGRVTVIPSRYPVAPQVVTIIHRLSGVKVLRFLLRQSGQNGIVETIDPDTVDGDAHASIIAGWALDDGKTITARLPQAAAEIEIREFEGPLTDPKAAFLARTPFTLMRPRVEPDLTVVTRDGRKLKARLIGLDAATGLSVMQIGGTLAALSPQPQITTLTDGQAVQIFAPERTKPEGEASVLNTYVTVGKIDATISRMNQEGSEYFDKFVVRGAEFSPDAIGGVACDPSGNTLGIV
ncbi:MAG TPA: hypothetical protein VKD91_04560, partial [Pyrinomonadaceae bacterium]|nr:hypothetical protein [Pyrinomonadaceae bacterium]